MPLIREDTGQLDERGRPIFGVVVTDANGIRIDDPSLTPEERADETRFHPVIQVLHARGDVTLSDGTVYNVDPDVIEANSIAHAHEISHHVGLAHEQYGHPLHLSRGHGSYHPLRDEFVHVCAPECGPVARSAEDAVAAFNDRVITAGHEHLIGTDTRPDSDDEHGPILSHAEVEARIRDAHAASNTEASV